MFLKEAGPRAFGYVIIDANNWFLIRTHGICDFRYLLFLKHIHHIQFLVNNNNTYMSITLGVLKI